MLLILAKDYTSSCLRAICFFVHLHCAVWMLSLDKIRQQQKKWLSVDERKVNLLAVGVDSCVQADVVQLTMHRHKLSNWGNVESRGQLANQSLGTASTICHTQTCQSVHVTCITRHLLSFTTAGYGSLLSQLHLVLVNSKIFFRLAYLTYSPLVSLLICKCYNTTIPSVLHLTVVVVSGMQL